MEVRIKAVAESSFIISSLNTPFSGVRFDFNSVLTIVHVMLAKNEFVFCYREFFIFILMIF